LKAENPGLSIGMVGAAVAVAPEASMRNSPAVDWVARGEFDLTVQEIAQGRPLARVAGLAYRADGRVARTPDRPVLEDMDRLPFVTPVYKRDLTVENYAIGYLRHPYVSLYTGRGCRSKCTFCLWPQTVGGQRIARAASGTWRRRWPRRRGCFPRCASSSSTTTRSPTTCRGRRPSPGGSGRSASRGR
jgi:radical SAM superfamily enzyme YgiQ (UPF0313 family)